MTGLFEVNRAGRHSNNVIFASQIVRLCPLSPIIRGIADRDADRDNVLERYESFYVNKYRNIQDYTFIHMNRL
jgi:hypothetical protein